MTGPDWGTGKGDFNNGPKLVGKPTEAVSIDNIETQALLDTRSSVSSIGHSFYVNHLSHLPLLPVSDILNVECADGNKLPYHGYIKASLKSSGISECTEQYCLFLVVPDTNYNINVPVLIATNILDEILKDCKTLHGDQYLQKAKLQTPWYLSLRCLTIRQRELKRHKNRLAIIRCAETTRITIGPNQSVNVKGYLDKELEYISTCAIIQECQDSSLPDFVDITPTVIQYSYKANGEVNVNCSNLTTNSVTISPKAVLCEVQPVTIDESVFDRIEREASKKIFDDIHIDSKLTPEQNEQVEALLRKHIDVFFQT